MTRLVDRLAELEKAALPAVQPGLVLIAQGGLTPEQQAEANAADAAGRVVLIVKVTDASLPDPAIERAGAEQ